MCTTRQFTEDSSTDSAPVLPTPVVTVLVFYNSSLIPPAAFTPTGVQEEVLEGLPCTMFIFPRLWTCLCVVQVTGAPDGFVRTAPDGQTGRVYSVNGVFSGVEFTMGTVLSAGEDHVWR